MAIKGLQRGAVAATQSSQRLTTTPPRRIGYALARRKQISEDTHCYERKKNTSSITTGLGTGRKHCRCPPRPTHDSEAARSLDPACRAMSDGGRCGAIVHGPPTLEAILDTRFLVPFVAQKPCASLYDLVSINPFCIPGLDFYLLRPSDIILLIHQRFFFPCRLHGASRLGVREYCAAGLLSPRLSGMITLTPLSCSGRPFPTVTRGRYIYMAPLHDVSEFFLDLFSVVITWSPFALSPSASSRR